MKNNQKGFTLIELMATLAILALITLIAVPAIGSIINNAEDSARATSIEMLENAGSMADVGDLPHDDAAGEMYQVMTLIEAGYVDLDMADALATGYVVKEGTGNSYTYNGTGASGSESGATDADDTPFTPEDLAPDASEGPARAAVPMNPEPTDIEAFEFELNPDGDGYILADYDTSGDNVETDVVIPSEYNGMPVTHIGYRTRAASFEGWYRPFDYSPYVDDTRITSVVIPDTVEHIGPNAFYGNSLTTVYLPDSVTFIGHAAFTGNNLEYIRFTRGIETIDQTAFNMNNLQQVYLPDSLKSVEYSAFAGNPNLQFVSIGADTTVRGSGTYNINYIQR